MRGAARGKQGTELPFLLLTARGTDGREPRARRCGVAKGRKTDKVLIGFLPFATLQGLVRGVGETSVHERR